MDQFSDEASSCVSSPPPDCNSKVATPRREEAVNTLNKALAARRTAISAAKVLWIAGEFEVEIFKLSRGIEVEYEQLLRQKLVELGWKEQRENDAPSGHGISDDCWHKILSMKSQYFQALQASYIVLVASLRQDVNVLPQNERESLTAYKRLVLGLVLFLSAERGRIPSRFKVEKLKRLENEIVQILTTMLKKSNDGILQFKEVALQQVHAAVVGSSHMDRANSISTPGASLKEEFQIALGVKREEVRPPQLVTTQITGKRSQDDMPRGRSKLQRGFIVDNMSNTSSASPPVVKQEWIQGGSDLFEV